MRISLKIFLKIPKLLGNFYVQLLKITWWLINCTLMVHDIYSYTFIFHIYESADIVQLTHEYLFFPQFKDFVFLLKSTLGFIKNLSFLLVT